MHGPAGVVTINRHGAQSCVRPTRADVREKPRGRWCVSRMVLNSADRRTRDRRPGIAGLVWRVHPRGDKVSAQSPLPAFTDRPPRGL